MRDDAQRGRVPRLASDVARGWIVASVGFALCLGLFIAVRLPPEDRSFAAQNTIFLLLFWTVLAVGFAGMNWLVFRRADAKQLARWLVATTPTARWRRIVWLINGGGAIPWALSGSAIALAAVVFLVQQESLRTDPIVIVLAVAAVAGSILTTISAYAVRYARANSVEGGIEFSGTEQPRFVDYFYLSVQVSTTFSTSDVTIATPRMRSTVSAHSLIAFTFNTVIVALLVSLLISTVS